MALNLDKSLYNTIVESKLENEQLISDLYSSFDNFTSDETQAAIEIIYNLNIINDEYNKYIVIYNKSVQDEQQSEEYIVNYGDSLQSIAAKMTGDFNNWKRIMEYNNLSDIYLEAGEIINIPNNI